MALQWPMALPGIGLACCSARSTDQRGEVGCIPDRVPFGTGGADDQGGRDAGA